MKHWLGRYLFLTMLALTAASSLYGCDQNNNAVEEAAEEAADEVDDAM